MDQRFKDWIIDQHAQMDFKDRQDFLRLLKFKPDEVAEIFSSHIRIWATAASFYLKIKFEIHDCRQESQELLKAFQEHFAKEMTTIAK